MAGRRHRVRRQVKWGVYAIALFVIVDYLVLPQLAGARKSLNLLGKVNFAYLIAGVVLEAASLASYSQLTHTVLRHEGPPRSRLLRINLSSLSVSHIMPGGTAPGTAVAFRLLTQSGIDGADAGFALAMQGVGSALVLNSILWLALLISVFVHGYNPLYAVAAGAGVVLMGLFAGVVVALTRGRDRSVDVIRRWSGHLPFLDGDRVAAQVRRVADRLGRFLMERQLLTRAVGWAALFWLFDAASLFVFIAALGKIVSPIDLLVAYGLAQVLAVIPITPSGLGVIEGVLIPTLVGFGVAKPTAILGVVGYRLVNFWLPIPVGGIAYLSLRLTNERWPARLRHAPADMARLDDHDAVREAADAVEAAGKAQSASTPTPETPARGEALGTDASTDAGAASHTELSYGPWDRAPHQASADQPTPHQSPPRRTPRLQAHEPNAARGSASA